MILILGSSSDPLAIQTQRCLEARGQMACTVSEEVLFSATSLVLERTGGRVSGLIQFDGVGHTLEDIEGVLLRLPRTWWPSDEFCLQDQMFVYHETMAAWYALLSSLVCPVVNLFGLGWWLRDAAYPELLRNRLAVHLGPALVPSNTSPPDASGILPTAPDSSTGARSTYIVGEAIIPRCEEDRAVTELLAPYTMALSSWQEENGLLLCRLDLATGKALKIGRVEPFPSVEGEPAPVLDRLASATADLFS